MLELFYEGASITSFLFFLLSLTLCIILIFKSNDFRLRKICKISISFPLLITLFEVFRGLVIIFNDIKRANDVSPSIMAGGYEIIALSALFGIAETMILLFLYALSYIKYDTGKRPDK